jgi:hypothetical protein
MPKLSCSEKVLDSEDGTLTQAKPPQVALPQANYQAPISPLPAPTTENRRIAKKLENGVYSYYLDTLADIGSEGQESKQGGEEDNWDKYMRTPVDSGLEGLASFQPRGRGGFQKLRK